MRAALLLFGLVGVGFPYAVVRWQEAVAGSRQRYLLATLVRALSLPTVAWLALMWANGILIPDGVLLLCAAVLTPVDVFLLQKFSSSQDDDFFKKQGRRLRRWLRRLRPAVVGRPVPVRSRKPR